MTPLSRVLIPAFWSPMLKGTCFLSMKKRHNLCTLFFLKFEALDISRKAADLTTKKVTGLSLSSQYPLEQI